MGLQVTRKQAQAMTELENRGLSFCCHFGTDNAVDLLEGMNRAFDMGCLYEWLNNYMGIVTCKI